MSEHNPEDNTEDTAPVPTKPGWKDRVYGVRSVAAVAVAGLIIGGGAGAAIHAATDDGGHDGRPGRMGFQGGPGGFGGPGGQMPQPPNGMPPNGMPPNGMPGATQPTTPPEDDDNS